MLSSSSNGSDVDGKWWWDDDDNDTAAATTIYVIGISISHDDGASIVGSKFNDRANLAVGIDTGSVSMQSWKVEPEESMIHGIIIL